MAGALDAARRLPVVIAGAGPAGTTTAIGLAERGVPVMAFEARGAVATRARNIFVRPQAREILSEVGLAVPGRDTTIMSIENGLRDIARERGVPIGYQTRVLDVAEHPDRVRVTLEGPRGGIRTQDASVFVDASGGRLEATSRGALERVPTGRSHVYVTAQYDSLAPFDRVYGAFDRGRNEGMFFFPLSERRGFISYYDLPPGQQITDEAALLARYDSLAGQLELGTPISPPQAFDARQHLSRSASAGRVLKIGDAAGNADPYIGAGVAAALVDARNAYRELAGAGTDLERVGNAARDVLRGHRMLARQAGLMVDVRGLGLRTLPSAHFDTRLGPEALGTSRVMDLTARALTALPIIT